MTRLSLAVAGAALGVVLATPQPLSAQPQEVLGGRALGMAGAFTAVADDASSVYWNPAGQVTGDYVSLVVEWQAHELGLSADDRGAGARRGSGALVAFSVPAIGFGYYRLDQRWTGPAVPQSSSFAEPAHRRATGSLLTDHFAVTLAQTLAEGLHVGVALKAVRGSGVDEFTHFEARSNPDAEVVLDSLSERRGPADTTFDADLGVMMDARRWRLGLSARNLRGAAFPTRFAEDGVRLARTARVGLAVLPADGLTVAVDADLTTGESADGRWRSLAVGAERWLPGRRWALRGGARFQTVDEARPVATFGTSVVAWKLVHADAQAAIGTDGRREWSVGARVAY